MTEPPSARPDPLQPASADSDHTPGDYATGGYDDRQDTGDASLDESRAEEGGSADEASQHGGREPAQAWEDPETFDQ
jgi:hypothetical protein